MIVPVTAGGTVIGALNLVRARRGAVTVADLREAEALGREVGAALDASRPATARLRTLRTPDPRPDLAVVRTDLASGAGGNPVALARRWGRRMLPELLDGPVRPDLADDLDLVLSELVGKAVRHAGGAAQVVLQRGGAALSVGVRHGDDRAPTVRGPGAGAAAATADAAATCRRRCDGGERARPAARGRRRGSAVGGARPRPARQTVWAKLSLTG